MAEITIRHCTLRLVRRGGWSWGPDPEMLVKKAKRVLPELIARRLAHLFVDGADTVIAAPVNITIPLCLRDLVDAGSDPGSEATFQQSKRWIAVLDRELERRFQKTGKTQGGPSPNLAQKALTKARELRPERQPRGSQSTLFFVLLDWRRREILDPILRSVPLRILESWHTALLRQLPSPVPQLSEQALNSVRVLVDELATSLNKPVPKRRAFIQHRILVAIELAVRLELRAFPTNMKAVLDDLLPLENTASNDPQRTPDRTPPEGTRIPPVGDSEETRLDLRPSAEQRGPRPLLEGEIAVTSALPFLMLGVLSRWGYVDALEAMLETAGLADESARFAMGLAYKVLEPPHRGWRRSGSAQQAAATFAGLDSPVPEPTLAGFQRKAAEIVFPLDVLISRLLVNAHESNKPLLLQTAAPSSSSELLLFDTDGLVPIVWTSDIGHIRELIRDCGPVTVIVPEDSAIPHVLRVLNAGNVRFVTDGPPVRGEKWRRLRDPEGFTIWTNDHDGSPRKLLTAGSLISESIGRTRDFVEELSIKRPAITVDPQPAFERSLVLASGFALGDIASNLWRDREPTDPLLALERFGDLDARVRFTPKSVQVRLPLGRRHRDLYEHGLLVDVYDVPWFGRRTLEFTGG